MDKYKLYGTTLIHDDNTLKDFAKCVYKGCPLDGVQKDGEERKDFIMELVNTSLMEDIGRTLINYEELLYNYRNEIGDLLYEMCNYGMPIPEIEFFGDKTINFFNELICKYVDIHYVEFERKSI